MKGIPIGFNNDALNGSVHMYRLIRSRGLALMFNANPAPYSPQHNFMLAAGGQNGSITHHKCEKWGSVSGQDFKRAQSSRSESSSLGGNSSLLGIGRRTMKERGQMNPSNCGYCVNATNPKRSEVLLYPQFLPEAILGIHYPSDHQFPVKKRTPGL
ncbi:MAG: hypothetical protein M1818_001753 [Claussenomyces sp. TS43310]|nr:MAG: hypothetical protein M1818_001753 [Claussenomyces sp. TS43310]